jgi:hypothetical protein
MADDVWLGVGKWLLAERGKRGVGLADDVCLGVGWRLGLSGPGLDLENGLCLCFTDGCRLSA